MQAEQRFLEVFYQGKAQVGELCSPLMLLTEWPAGLPQELPEGP